MPSNASIAIELQTTGAAQVLKDMNAVEQATQRIAKGAKSQPIDLGLKKQLEEANREALRFQQMNRGLAAQVIGRSIVSSTLSTAMQGSQLAEPVKRAFEMLADIGLQMLAIATTMKAIETTNVATKGLTNTASNVASNLAGGTLAGTIATNATSQALTNLSRNDKFKEALSKITRVVDDAAYVKRVREWSTGTDVARAQTMQDMRNLGYPSGFRPEYMGTAKGTGKPFFYTGYSSSFLDPMADPLYRQKLTGGVQPGQISTLSKQAFPANVLSLDPYKRAGLALNVSTPVPSASAMSMNKLMNYSIPGTGGMAGAAGGVIGIAGIAIALDSVIKQFGLLNTELKDTKKNIGDTGLVVDNLGGTWTEFARGFADSGLFGFGWKSNTPDLGKDQGISKETVAIKAQSIRGAQATDLLGKAGRELLTLSDGSKQWVKSAEDFNKDEIKNALNRKEFQANDFAAAKRLTDATTEAYNRQMAFINAAKQLQDIQRDNHDIELATLKQQVTNAAQWGEFWKLDSQAIVGLRKEALQLSQDITDIEREKLGPTRNAIANQDFLNQLYGNRGYAGEQARSMERSKALGEKNLIPQFEAVFQRLLKDTSSVLTTAEKSALAWDMVNKDIAKTTEYGAKASALIPDLMKSVGKKSSVIDKFQAGITLNETLRSSTATDEDKRLAMIRYQLDIANANREAIRERGKIEPFAQRADRGSQEAFKIIAGAKAQDSTARGMQELKNINAQMLQVLNVNNAFLNKLVIEAQKVK